MLLLDPSLTRACVAMIAPQMLKARELFGSIFQFQRYRRTVL
jgi:hypothetical protein